MSNQVKNEISNFYFYFKSKIISLVDNHKIFGEKIEELGKL